jgi:hypothetical protein
MKASGRIVNAGECTRFLSGLFDNGTSEARYFDRIPLPTIVLPPFQNRVTL